jgi:hypothetical protein
MCWECAEDNTLNLDTNFPALTIVTTDTNLINRTLIAKYGIIPVDTIQVPTIVNGDSIYVNGFLDSIGDGKYTYLNRDDFTTMSMYFAPSTGFKFESWTSEDPKYNGRTDKPMNISGAYRNNIVPINPKIGIPVVTPAPLEPWGCGTVKFEITYNTREHPDGLMRYDIFPATANGVFPIAYLVYNDITDTVHIGFNSEVFGSGEGSICGPNKPESLDVYLAMNENGRDQFAIESYTIEGQSGTKVVNAEYWDSFEKRQIEAPIDPSIVEKVSVPDRASQGQCSVKVKVVIRRKVAKVQIVREMEEDKPLPPFSIFGYQLNVPPPTIFTPAYPLDKVPESVEYEDYPKGRLVKKAIKTIKVAVGSTIAISPTFDPAGVKSVSYDCTAPNICQPVNDGMLEVYIDDNSDKVVKLLGEPNFVLEYIQFKRLSLDVSEPTYSIVSCNANGWGEGLPGDKMWLGNPDDYDKGIALKWNEGVPTPNENHTKTAWMRFYFSKPLNVQTLETSPGNTDQGIWVEEILPRGETKRLDGKEPKNFYLRLQHDPE